MQRTFCDCCGKQIVEDNPGRLKPADTVTVFYGRLPHEFRNIYFELTARLSTHGDGRADLCKYCMIDAVNKLDDRPVPDGCAPSS